MTYCTNCGTKLAAGATKCDACGAGLVATKMTPLEAPSHDTAVSSTDHLKTRIASSDTGEPAKPIAVGTQVGRVLGGRYQLDQCIGSGGMGEIYRARRLHIGDTVAVKVLRPDVIENDKTRQRFYREARAAAMLHHPNAVVIHDFGEDTDGTAYIVMELLIGRSLRQLLVESGTIVPRRAYTIIRQACAALDAGHRNGIVHRDIKPDNIFLLNTHDDEDHIKILDFGIAKLADKALDTLSIEEQRLTNVGTVIGTPHYMSPEQCQGEEADSRSDIYSLGVVLYEMLTGVVPFVAKTPTGVAIKHVTEQPRPLRELNPALNPAIESVVLRAMSKEANSRPQNAIELARDFDMALRSEANYEGSTVRFSDSGEQKTVTPQAVSQENATEILKPAANTGGQPRLETSRQSYDTVVSSSSTDTLGKSATDALPSPGTEVLTPSKTTGEQKLGTIDLKTQVMDTPEPVPPVAKPEPVPPAAKESAPVAKPVAKEDKPPKSEKKADKADKKAKVEPSKPIESAKPAPAAKPTSVAKAPEPAPAKSRTPLLIGVGALLVLLAVFGAWMLGGGEEKPSTVTNSTSQTASTSASPATSSNQFPQASAPDGMVLVINGVLQVGRDGGKENEAPSHVVTLKAFYIGKTEVTNEEYQAFIAQTGYAAPPSWSGGTVPAGSEKLPVTDVSWEDANAFAKWAGKRLPTEEEWEYAARGSNPDNLYPWGAKWLDDAANVLKDGAGLNQLSPVGQFAAGASPFGVQDMIGNAWEWTASDYKAYPGGTINPPAAGYKNLKVIRGGSFNTNFSDATATLRSGWPAGRKDWPKSVTPDYSKTGFRLAKDAD